jgi:hypothetical protein
MIRNCIIFLGSLILLGSNATAQPSISVIRTEKAPAIDGFVNDPEWNQAAIVSDFIQREPLTGKPVSEKTEFLFLIDRNNIYIGIRCFDNPETITAKELARDVSLGEDDRIQVLIDTYLDGRSGYWFQIGPRGSIGDALISENGKDFNKSWDGLWDGRARITSEGWEAEMVIPFKTLAFDKNSDTWGLKLIRHIRRKSESSYWPATTLNADRFAISDAGLMKGMTGITQGVGLDLIPYLTGGLSKKENEDSKPVIDGGADLFYQITPSVKSALTFNTDFAQTEVDEKQINLTRFNLYFPEKRDFFLDGSNYFTFGINGDRENRQGTQMIPFFSRRVGLESSGDPLAIKYGGKITGKAGKVNFGLLHIKDNNQWDNTGYSAGRLSLNFGKQSSVGLIATNGNASSDAQNSLAGIDLRLARADFRGSNNVIFNLYGVKSFTEGLRDDDLSFGAELNYPNDFLNFRFGYLRTGKNFNPGLGFVPRKDISDIYGSLFLGPRPTNSPILQIKSGIDYVFISNISTGQLETGELGLDFIKITMLSGDEISFFTDFNYEALDNAFNIFDTISISPGSYNFWRHRLVLSSAKRRNLWATARIELGSFYSGSRKDLFLQAGYKIGVPVFLGLESDLRWVDLKEGSFIAQIYRINLNLLFGPKLTWYNYAQYDNKTETIGWQSRLQWIITPGKEIFVTFNSPLIDPFNRWQPEVYEARIKAKYTIRF